MAARREERRSPAHPLVATGVVMLRAEDRVRMGDVREEDAGLGDSIEENSWRRGEEERVVGRLALILSILGLRLFEFQFMRSVFCVGTNGCMHEVAREKVDGLFNLKMNRHRGVPRLLRRSTLS